LKILIAAALIARALPSLAQSAAEPTQQLAILPLAEPQSFICSDGQTGIISYERAAGILRVVRGGEVMALQEQVGRTPTRFVTGLDGVDLDGDTATILRGAGSRAQPVATCRRVPAAPTEGMIWGSLSKRDRAALAPGSRAKVLLIDAVRADAPAIEIASTQIVTRDNQAPLHFLLAYDPARIAPRGQTYRLQARIEQPDGQLRYITDTAVFVLEGPGPQAPVELTLVRAGPK
jgi:putative lipoprotein